MFFCVCVCKLEIDLPRSHQSDLLVMTFVLMKYHNFTNRKTGVLVLGDHDNSGAYLRNYKRLRSLKCAYIQDGAGDCVFENDEGVLRLKWHGTWNMTWNMEHGTWKWECMCVCVCSDWFKIIECYGCGTFG